VFKKNEKKSPEEQIVSCLADVETRAVNDELEFVLLACDGIWDVMSNEEVVDFVRGRIAEKMDPPTVRV
jgi:protein phosphatase 2C family protein 2/3